MKAEVYKQVENKIYDRFPSGMSYNAFKKSDELWKEFTGTNILPENFDSETALHSLNVKATQRHIIRYNTLLHRLYARRNAKRMSHEGRIKDIYTIRAIARDNVKMSVYGLNKPKYLTVKEWRNNINT